ncbi:MAG TPA: DUF1640 domain-containing protein [Gammaproteobacteria bacterium]|nr:DUF1640 domain-containing protein [Gammaproteobacteria bacterium]
MISAAFDTLKFLQKLKAGGMPEEQAIALTEAQNEAFIETTNHMIATKTDLLELKQEFKQDIADLRLEVKQDITNLRTEINHELVDVKSNLKLHSWMIGFVLTGIAALILKAFFN